jgi:hypothetical protein
MFKSKIRYHSCRCIVPRTHPSYFTFIPMEKLVLNYARSSVTTRRIKCDRTVTYGNIRVYNVADWEQGNVCMYGFIYVSIHVE